MLSCHLNGAECLVRCRVNISRPPLLFCMFLVSGLFACHHNKHFLCYCFSYLYVLIKLESKLFQKVKNTLRELSEFALSFQQEETRSELMNPQMSMMGLLQNFGCDACCHTIFH